MENELWYLVLDIDQRATVHWFVDLSDTEKTSIMNFLTGKTKINQFKIDEAEIFLIENILINTGNSNVPFLPEHYKYFH